MITRVRVGDPRIFARFLPIERTAVNDNAADRRSVSADELRRGMNDDVRAVLDRSDEVRGRERRVNDEGNAVSVRDLRDPLDVRNVRVRVAESFDVKCFRFGSDRLLYLVGIVRIDERRRYTRREGKRVREKIVCSAVNVFRGNDMLSRTGKSEDRVIDRRRPGSRCERRNAVFKRRDPFFKYVVCRVRQSSVYIARVAKTESVRRVSAVTENEGRTCIYGNGSRIGRGVGRLLTDMKLFRFKTPVFRISYIL